MRKTRFTLLPLSDVRINLVSGHLVVPAAVDDVIIRADVRDNRSVVRRVFFRRAVPRIVHIFVKNNRHIPIRLTLAANNSTIRAHLRDSVADGLFAAKRDDFRRVTLSVRQINAPTGVTFRLTADKQIIPVAAVAYLVPPRRVAFYLKEQRAVGRFYNPLRKFFFCRPTADVGKTKRALSVRLARRNPRLRKRRFVYATFGMMPLFEPEKRKVFCGFFRHVRNVRQTKRRSLRQSQRAARNVFGNRINA